MFFFYSFSLKEFFLSLFAHIIVTHHVADKETLISMNEIKILFTSANEMSSPLPFLEQIRVGLKKIKTLTAC